MNWRRGVDLDAEPPVGNSMDRLDYAHDENEHIVPDGRDPFVLVVGSRFPSVNEHGIPLVRFEQMRC